MSDKKVAEDPQDPRQGQGVELFVEGVHRRMMNPWGRPVVGWRGVAGAENGRAFCNAGGGFALLWVVHRKPGPDGQLTRLYEQPCIVENPGAIVVVLDDRGRIGLVQNFRGVRGPRLKGVPVSNYVRTVDEQNRWGELVTTLGQWTWECPRGLAPPEKVASSDEDGGEALKRHVLKVARLEAAEEAGFELKNPRIVGSMNTNTTFFAHDQMVVLAQLAHIGATNHENLEQIGAVRFFSLEELGAMRDAGEFTDGITLAALAMCGLALPLPARSTVIGHTMRERLDTLAELVGSRGRAMLDRAGSDQVISGSVGGVFGSLDPAQDREIRADRAMGSIIVEALKECFGDELKSVVIEGRKDLIQVSEGGRYEAFVDPLDNSQGCYATLKMPPASRRSSPHMFAATIAIFERPTDGSPMCYKHVVGSCVIALDSSTSFVYVRDEVVDASKKAPVASGDDLFVRKDGRAMGLNHTINVECYYSDMRDLVAKAFRGINGAFRSAGCAAMEQVHVATGAYAVFFCDTQKQHEPPATYGLVKAAGGVCFTIRGMNDSPDEWELVPLDEQPFDFDKKIPVLMAGNEGYAREVFDLLKRAGSA